MKDGPPITRNKPCCTIHSINEWQGGDKVILLKMTSGRVFGITVIGLDKDEADAFASKLALEATGLFDSINSAWNKPK